MIDLMKIPTNNEEKEQYLNLLYDTNELDEIYQLTTLNHDIDIIRVLVDIIKNRNSDIESNVYLNPLHSMEVIKIFIDNNLTIHTQISTPKKMVEYNNKSLLEIIAYFVNRDKVNNILFHNGIFILTKDDFNVILELIDVYYLKDKINIFISKILCNFNVDLLLFNELHETFQIEFNYSFYEGKYPLISQVDCETIHKMMSLNYKYKTKILTLNCINNLEELKLHIDYAEKQNRVSGINYILCPQFNIFNDFEETVKYHVKMKHMFLESDMSVFMGFLLRNKSDKSTIEKLKLLLKHNFLPKLEEKEMIVEILSKRNCDEEYIEFLKSIDVFFDEKNHEEHDEIKEKLFNENISVRQFRKLSKKLRTINFEYKGKTLLMIHYKNLKIGNYILNHQNHCYISNISPLELDLDIKLFKRYIRNERLFIEKETTIIENIVKNKEKINIIMKSKNRFIFIEYENLPIDITEYILPNLSEIEKLHLFETNVKRYDVFIFLITKVKRNRFQSLINNVDCDKRIIEYVKNM